MMGGLGWIVLAIVLHPLVDRVVRWLWPSDMERGAKQMIELQRQAVRKL